MIENGFPGWCRPFFYGLRNNRKLIIVLKMTVKVENKHKEGQSVLISVLVTPDKHKLDDFVLF